jgi:hypothetical protein
LAGKPVVLDRHVLALDVADLAEPFTERSGTARGDLGRHAVYEADDRQWLLRSRRERSGGCRTAEQRDERASFQVIEFHSVPCAARPNCRISNWRGSVRRCRTDFATWLAVDEAG